MRLSRPFGAESRRQTAPAPGPIKDLATERRSEREMLRRNRSPLAAVQVHEVKLPADAALLRKVRTLSRLKPLRSAADLILNWALIVTAMFAAMTITHPAVWAAAAVVIGARQHALLILAHEAIHFRLAASKRWNDRLCNWLIAFPLFASIKPLRGEHLAHHFHLFTDKDTELLRKKRRPGWTFPTTRRKLLGLLFRDLVGASFLPFLKFLLTRPPSGESPSKKSGSRLDAAERALFYVGFFGAVIAADFWIPLILFWFLPAFTVLPAIFRMRNIGRHFGLPRTHDLNMSRNVVRAPLWERLLIAPHHVGYHLDHHLFPSVPYYNLPALHRTLLAIPEYAANAHQSDSYLGLRDRSVLNDVTAPLVAKAVNGRVADEGERAFPTAEWEAL